MNNRQNLLLVENAMSDLKKSDCISVENAFNTLGVTRNTLNAYINAVGAAKHKFPLDKKVYITKTDFSRVKQLLEDNRGDE